jgi:hypothetical protein
VVFYEMLTGELPLGKFAAPSRKVHVDVRLDDVVLRALEKEPERRYQQASQVKTAVETIASGGGGGAGGFVPPQSPANTEAMVQEILARDYTLSIRSCLRRGWGLVRNNFWPIIGISALITVLLGVAHSAGVVISPSHDGPNGVGSIIGLLVSGPLMGGLYLYFLNKIRGQPVTIETAFAGFSNRFLHLFLGNFVATLLMVLGFLCLILPGIYLWIAWTFTLPLIVDRRLDFWSAMEVSRKMVTRHWWKLLAFVVVLALLKYAGLLIFCLGIFITGPIAMAALMYAYEDVFGTAGRPADQPAAFGPQGTAVVGGAKPYSSGSGWKPAVAIGLALVALVFVLIVGVVFTLRMANRRAHQARAVAMALAEQARLAAAARSISFGPAIQQVIQARATGTNQFLDLDTGKLVTPPAQITALLGGSEGDDNARAWHALDIPENSWRFPYIEWLWQSGVDLIFAGNGMVMSFGGMFLTVDGNDAENGEKWDAVHPDQVRDALGAANWTRRAATAARDGLAMPPRPKSSAVVSSARQMESGFGGGPTVNMLTQEQSDLWFFQTRDGSQGVLRIVGFTDEPDAVKIRYKLIQSIVGDDGVSAEDRENLAARLEAAAMISSTTEKDRAMAALAQDAAGAGDVEIVKNSLRQIGGHEARDAAAHESVRRLAQHGRRKQAVEVARTISSMDIRDKALSELAQ